MLSDRDYKKLCKQLDRFGFRDYKEFLDSSLWKEFRSVLYKKDKPQYCHICHKEHTYLYLHHKTYRRILDPSNMIWICSECHEKVHKEINESISNETDKLLTKLNGNRQRKRKGNLRIIPSSGLPETLHQSIHASGLIREIRDGGKPAQCLEKYYKNKVKRNDELMLKLLEGYSEKVMKYISTFTTS